MIRIFSSIAEAYFLLQVVIFLTYRDHTVSTG